MHFLLLVLLSGGVAYGTQRYITEAAARGPGPGQVPTIFGMDSTKLMIGIGIGSLLLGGPLIAALGVGAAVGGVVARGTIAMAGDAYDAAQVTDQRATAQVTDQRATAQVTDQRATGKRSPFLRPLQPGGFARSFFGPPSTFLLAPATT